uniref:ABC_transp_aux domain-containing protein n=1 Tax=Bursaphelenchus xylophilus TaxID=6326 RepID=A0A1I7SEP2_BURXY
MGVVDTLGGPRRTAVIGLLLLFSLLLLVAGAVMLGIGITRLNESREQKETPPFSFILQVQTLNVSYEDLAADFKKSMERIKVQAEDAAGQYGVVSVLGVSPNKKESADEINFGPFGADETPVAILTVAYPSEYAPSRDDLTKKFQGDKFSVEKTYGKHTSRGSSPTHALQEEQR